jgi:exosortase/archaeosortase family protein
MVKGYIWTVFNKGMMKSLKEINRFIFLFAAVYFPFLLVDTFLVYELPLLPTIWNFIYHILLKFVMGGTVAVLSVFGYEVHHTYDIVWITGAKQSLFIGHPCLAFDLMVMFAALIFAYPGNKKSKWWIIPAGCLLIQILNVIRMCLLTVAAKERLGSLEFEHHYLFKFTVYALIFIIWALWIKYFPAEEGKAKAS